MVPSEGIVYPITSPGVTREGLFFGMGLAYLSRGGQIVVYSDRTHKLTFEDIKGLFFQMH